MYQSIFWALTVWLGWSAPVAGATGITGRYQCDNGKILLRSVAPLETIEARSNRLKGLIDPATQSFAWSVEVKSFQGFNNGLQREHFNESYLESEQFPKASFSGRIIEKVEFDKDGTYQVRAKGVLSVHGVDQERIIRATLDIKNGKINVHAAFKMPLADHNIAIPRIVFQKIAEEVDLIVDAEMRS